MVSLRIAKWVLVRKEFVNIMMNDILFNWEAYIACGLMKERGGFLALLST